MVTPLPSHFLVDFQLSSWNTGHLHSCRAPVRDREISPSSLTPCQPYRPSTQLIQTKWSRACIPPLLSWQLIIQYLSGGCLLMWDWQEMKEQTDLQKSAVRLHRHRTLSPTERPRHFSTPGSMETERMKIVDTRHTLTQFRDWNWPSRPLSSVCAQGTVVWEPSWRGLVFQTLPFVSADKLTEPQATSFSPAQNMPKDVS